MSAYIKRKYKGKLDGCIVDELHEYNNDSGQGDAMAEIFSCITERMDRIFSSLFTAAPSSDVR